MGSSDSGRRFTSAHVMAAVSLFVALGGTAWGLARNTVGTKQLKANAVKSKKIATGAVKKTDLADGAVITPKLAANAVTGATADESTFGQVPSALQAVSATSAASAANADHAATADTATNATSATTAQSAGNAQTVGGTEVDEVLFRTNDVVNQNVFSGGGLTINADCDAGNDLDVTVSTASDNAVMHSYSIDTVGGAVDNVVNQTDFDTTENPLTVVTDDEDQVLTLQFSRAADGNATPSAVSVFLLVEDGTLNIDCLLTGHVLRTGGSLIG